MSLPNQVRIVEVGARDGLQNEPQPVPTDVKIEFINKLSETGLKVIEATSFVSKKWIPQLQDAEEVFLGINKLENIEYPVLVPNIQGMERALACNVYHISVFAAASESFAKKNTNCTIKESLDRISKVIESAKEKNIKVRGYISCVLGCPYEGEINPEKVLVVAKELYNMGCYEVSLGDTIGVGTPLKSSHLIETIAKEIPIKSIAMHFHDTYGQALANIYASLALGISTIDSSIAGLGGCPYAPGASGNVATEDVCYMLEGMNIETGVDFDKLLDVSSFVTQILGHPSRSKVAIAKLAKKIANSSSS